MRTGFSGKGKAGSHKKGGCPVRTAPFSLPRRVPYQMITRSSSGMNIGPSVMPNVS